eukprot:TRINITY_DN31232_c0_g1_i1.p3 TRINITY_DN31232_c0_g1~~TRINITY_DN31232_c0_g1_i1.p3  ORF type:complete len:124 (+),score=25.01 TRINITY_DN31232_c0_g1_i1:58-429(+)
MSDTDASSVHSAPNGLGRCFSGVDGFEALIRYGLPAPDEACVPASVPLTAPGPVACDCVADASQHPAFRAAVPAVLLPAPPRDDRDAVRCDWGVDHCTTTFSLRKSTSAVRQTLQLAQPTRRA